MPVSANQEMGSRSAPPNGSWPNNARRGAENPNLNISDPTRNMDFSELSDRLAELERLLRQPRRQNSTNQPPVAGANNPNTMAAIPPSATVTQPHPGTVNQQPVGSAGFSPPRPPQNHPVWIPGTSGSPAHAFLPPTVNATGPSPRPFNPQMHQIPPPPYSEDIFRNFSLCSQQEYLVHESRLYQRINFHTKIRLGYAKAISVLQRELENFPNYERIIRPYQIDQPECLPDLSPLIPISEARLFADTVRALIEIIGMQRSCYLLENAKVEDVPGVRYEIQRISIPSRVEPIPLEHENVHVPSHSASEIGPFARPRSDSASTGVSSAPSMYSWNPAPMMSPPPPPPPTANIIDEPTPSGPVHPEDFSAPAIPPPPAPAPQRGILRRTASGSTFSPKRVTITDPQCHCRTHFSPTSPTFEPGVPIMSPVSMSPVKMEDVPIQQNDVNTEFQQHGLHNRVNEFKSIKPEEGVLQQMAAAQM
jgi:hypothetical protein